MSASPSNMHPSQFVEGVRIPAAFSAELLRSVINYKPKDDDIFIVTYPKCGTTWTHHTLALILRHGDPFGEDFDFARSSPHIELSGLESVDNGSRNIFKMHIPSHLAPWSDKAKYIHVSRNPKDACVSFFHHHKSIPVQWFAGNFDEFFEYFMSGDVDFGDYFDHLQGWYEHRHDPNVLFLTYEEMKENPEAAILKMASFIDDEKYAEPLRRDRQKLENVMKYSSFEEMKATVNKSIDGVFSMSLEDFEKSKLPQGIKEMVTKLHSYKDIIHDSFVPKSSNFVRKGIVGDWKNYFSEEQSRRMDEKFAEKTKYIEIAKVFKQ